MEEFEYKELYKYLTNIMLNVTDDCNLACRYCFVEQHPHYMTLDTAKAAVDWLYNNLQKKIELNILKKDEQNKCNLNFFGGEPLLCYDSIIVPLVQYCEEKYPNIFKFGMTTNGTLLTEDKLKFIANHNFGLLLSIDGAPETQNFNRPCRDYHINSSDLLEKNIPNILKYYPNIMFRSTIYAPTIHNLFENYLYAEKMGFKNYVPIPDCRHEWTNKQKNILQQEISKIYTYRLMQILDKKSIMTVHKFDEFLNNTFKVILHPNSFLNQTPTVLRCGLGTTNGSIGYDGNIYGCQEQTSRDEKNIFLIGNIFNGGIDKEKHYKLLETYYKAKISTKLQYEKCKKCALKNYCCSNHSACPSMDWDLYQDLKGIPDIRCYYDKLIYQNSLIFLECLRIEQPSLFNAYVKKYFNTGGKKNELSK